MFVEPLEKAPRMERDGATMSLHQRLSAALARGARAQEHSREIVEATLTLRARLKVTVADVQARRAARRRA